MPLFILNGDKTRGHSPGCWGPATVTAQTCLNVKINNKAPVIVGDMFSTHMNPANCGDNPTHTPAMIPASMSRSVFINGKRALRDSDILNCGDSMNSAGGNVFCEGGGLGAPGFTPSGTSVNFIIGAPVIQSYPETTWRRRVQYNGPLSQTVSFLNWCQTPSTFAGVAYTPITDESTGDIYRNYPNQGSLDLPSYAPEYLRNPIPIIFFTNDDFPNGISLSEDGVISGIPTQTSRIRRSGRNGAATNNPIQIAVYAKTSFNAGARSSPYTVNLWSVDVENC